MPPTESESIDDPSQVPKEDVFKIMVATDLHLGYNEKDPIRGLLFFYVHFVIGISLIFVCNKIKILIS